MKRETHLSLPFFTFCDIAFRVDELEAGVFRSEMRVRNMFFFSFECGFHVLET